MPRPAAPATCVFAVATTVSAVAAAMDLPPHVMLSLPLAQAPCHHLAGLLPPALDLGVDKDLGEADKLIIASMIS